MDQNASDTAELGPVREPARIAEGTRGRPHARVPGTDSTYWDPAAPFPEDLMALTATELHVLHSKVSRRLEREHLDGPHGPHPLTLDRHRELTVELDARENPIVPAPAPPTPGGDLSAPEGVL